MHPTPIMASRDSEEACIASGKASLESTGSLLSSTGSSVWLFGHQPSYRVLPTLCECSVYEGGLRRLRREDLMTPLADLICIDIEADAIRYTNR